ncbi:MAG TPA: peptidase M48 [Roseibacterium sp.]|nr:peptidase M48 [Roseibacterium sp.]
MRPLIALIAALTLSACVAPTQTAAPSTTARSTTAQPHNVPMSVARAIEVTRRMEPIAESFCRSRTQGQNCDFEFLVNRDPRAGVNAFQALHPENGRPVITLTVGLIRAVRNDDELAFVIGHEVAHHIAQHIAQQEAAARAGALIFGASAQQRGGNREQIIEAAQAGALLGARQFSQSAELEADSLGTQITCRAGFDALAGARFFSLLPDPRAGILSTHPPNAARVATVRRAVAQHCGLA